MMYYAPWGVYVSASGRLSANGFWLWADSLHALARFHRHPPSEHPPAQGNVPVGGEEDHLPVAVGNAEHQDLALETGDPLRWEVDDGDDLAIDQRLRLVVRGELGAR